MSRSYWCIGIAIVGALIVAGAILALTSNYYLDKRARAQDAADEHRAYANSLVSCADIEVISDRVACQIEAINAEYQREHAHEDLIAQQEMAVWSFAMLLVSAVMLIVTGAGVYFVARTLTASQDAVKQARRQADITEKTLLRWERPYLFPKILDDTGLLNPGSFKPGIAYTLVNYGKTPAITRQIFAELVPISEIRAVQGVLQIADDAPIKQWYEVVAVNGSLEAPMSVSLAGSKAGERWDRRETLVFHAHITYSDPSRALDYVHHFALYSCGGGPFRLEYSKHYTKNTEKSED